MRWAVLTTRANECVANRTKNRNTVALLACSRKNLGMQLATGYRRTCVRCNLYGSRMDACTYAHAEIDRNRYRLTLFAGRMRPFAHAHERRLARSVWRLLSPIRSHVNSLTLRSDYSVKMRNESSMKEIKEGLFCPFPFVFNVASTSRLLLTCSSTV